MAEDAVPPPAPEATRARFRLTAVSGILAAAALVASYFLPWIVIPEAERPRLHAALAPGIDEESAAHPALADQHKILLAQVDKGRLTGLDLFLYARSSWALNRLLEGADPLDRADPRPWVVQRTFLLAAIVFAVLPVSALVAVIALLLGRFRRVGAPTLALLIVSGGIGAALTTAWLRFWIALSDAALIGDGLKLALGASVAQTLVGLLGVTTRTWWRVYVGSLASLGVLGALAWAYLARGATL